VIDGNALPHLVHFLLLVLESVDVCHPNVAKTEVGKFRRDPHDIFLGRNPEIFSSMQTWSKPRFLHSFAISRRKPASTS
jgi:hypothetical protein